MQYSLSSSVQQNWENFVLSLENATKKHVPVTKIQKSRRNIIPLSKERTAVVAEKIRGGSCALKTRHSAITEFMQDGLTKKRE